MVDGKVSRIKADEISAMDRAAQELAANFRADLVVVIGKDHGAMVPGADVTLGYLAQRLRTIAEGLEKAHERYQGRTYCQIEEAEAMN